MSFFMSSEELLGTKLLEIVYILIGLITIYTGVKNVMDKKNPSKNWNGYILDCVRYCTCIW